MVRAELERLADWPSLDRIAQLKALFTALVHDAGITAPCVSCFGERAASGTDGGRSFAHLTVAGMPVHGTR